MGSGGDEEFRQSSCKGGPRSFWGTSRRCSERWRWSKTCLVLSVKKQEKTKTLWGSRRRKGAATAPNCTKSDNSRNLFVWTERGGMMCERSLINWVRKKGKKEEVEGESRNRATLRRRMPPDRRSSGKQKRLHTLLCLICLRVLSTVGSVSVTPLPPFQHGRSPSTSSLHLHVPPSAPSNQPSTACCGPPLSGQGWRQGGPETEADSVAEAASAKAVGTTGPAQFDPVALHVHHQNRRRQAITANPWQHTLHVNLWFLCCCFYCRTKIESQNINCLQR